MAASGSQKIIASAAHMSLHDAAVVIIYATKNNQILEENSGLMERAHPNASKDEIHDALTRAGKLFGDCLKYFTYSEDYSYDLDRALEKVKIENPGFSLESYDLARFHIANTMR